MRGTVPVVPVSSTPLSSHAIPHHMQAPNSLPVHHSGNLHRCSQHAQLITISQNHWRPESAKYAQKPFHVVCMSTVTQNLLAFPSLHSHRLPAPLSFSPPLTSTRHASIMPQSCNFPSLLGRASPPLLPAQNCQLPIANPKRIPNIPIHSMTEIREVSHVSTPSSNPSSHSLLSFPFPSRSKHLQSPTRTTTRPKCLTAWQASAEPARQDPSNRIGPN